MIWLISGITVVKAYALLFDVGYWMEGCELWIGEDPLSAAMPVYFKICN